MAKKNTYAHPESLSSYEALISSLAGIEKKGASMPYTSMNGHMFSFLDAEGHLNLRLDEKGRSGMISNHGARQSVQHGIVMKEYIVVPDELLKNAQQIMPYLEASLAYVKTLKPKK
jgi:hypothetical protein